MSDILKEMEDLLGMLQHATRIDTDEPKEPTQAPVKPSKPARAQKAPVNKPPTQVEEPVQIQGVGEDMAAMKKEGFVVTADEVEGNVDYEKLIEFWGCDAMTQEHVDRFVRLTGKTPHPMLRRGIYYAHRDFDKILDCYERGERFYLYTGRGPSASGLHVGHCVPFIMNKHLQDAFNVPLVIQVTDDEKFFAKDMTLEESYRLGRENIRDIIAFGFDITKTFIFSDIDYAQYLRPNACKVQESISLKKMCNIFGHTVEKFLEINVGKLAYPAYQAVPSFSSTFPVHFQGQKLRCLIPCAIDQDPYFRMTRDIAEKLGEYKTSTLYSKFLPDLSGPGKMSSTKGIAVFLSDTPKQITKSVGKAFSGGRDDLEEHRKYGANLEIDVCYQYLRFFLESDEELAEIEREYSSGHMPTSAVKKKLVDTLVPFVKEFQDNRKMVTDDVIDAFMAIRPLQF